MDPTAITASATTTTGGGQDPNTQVAGAGAGTGSATQVQAAPGTTQPTQPQTQQTQQIDKPAAAPKFTDEDMRQARTRWEAEAQAKADKAAQEAQQAEAIAQGKAQEVAKERLETIKQHEATIKERDEAIARMEPVLAEYMASLTKEWPKSILDKKPSEGGYASLLNWYESYKDIATDYVTNLQKAAGQSKAGQYAQYPGVGKTPPPADPQTNGKEAQAAQSRLYRQL